MQKQQSLIKNTMVFMIGNLGSKFISFFMLPFYTIYLTKEMYGTFDLISTTVILLSALVGLKLNSALYRFILDQRDEAVQNRILSNAVAGMTISLLIFLILGLVLNSIFPMTYGWYLIICVLVSVVSFFWTFVARAFQRNAVYSFSGIIATVMSLLVALLLILFTSLRVEAMILSQIIAQLSVFIYIEYKIGVFSRIALEDISLPELRRLIRFGLPLLPTDLFWWVANLSNRYFIIYFLGTAANGVFAVSSKISTLLIMLNTIFSMAWLENSILHYGSPDRDNYFSKTFDTYHRFLFTVAIVLIPLTSLVFRFMLADSYIDAIRYTPLLYLGAVFYGFMHFYESGFLSAKRTGPLFYGMLVFGILNLLGNYFFISWWGLQGASFTFCITYLLLWLVLERCSGSSFNIRFPLKTFIILLGVTLVVSVPVLLGVINPWLQSTSLLAGLLLFLLLNKELLASLLGRFKTFAIKS